MFMKDCSETLLDSLQFTMRTVFRDMFSAKLNAISIKIKQNVVDIRYHFCALMRCKHEVLFKRV